MWFSLCIMIACFYFYCVGPFLVADCFFVSLFFYSGGAMGCCLRGIVGGARKLWVSAIYVFSFLHVLQFIASEARF